ncbi:MAG TPA: hypothetical protein VK427_23230 [Kofleriaceae bacterium]|nr:hypothetical protein [Kofleriaceae bacterium]
MNETSTPEDQNTSEEATQAPHINSVDATMGQPIVARVMARQAELEGILADLPESDVTLRNEITFALDTVAQLLTGDLEQVPAVVVVDMNRWLERNKHLGESPTT